MALNFYKVDVRGYLPRDARDAAYLKADNWDDYGFKTMFSLTVFDEQGKRHSIGNVKIGFPGQRSGWTRDFIDDQFHTLPRHFFSLGQDADYYRNIMDLLSPEMADNLLVALGDVAYVQSALSNAESEEVFYESLLRWVSRTSIDHQYKRILAHGAPLTDYNFFYEKTGSERYAGVRVEFSVEPNSKPSSNIHVLIGRNGVGKTTILNSMVGALFFERGAAEEVGSFFSSDYRGRIRTLSDDYFAGVVSVSFSAFDPFTCLQDQSDASAGMRYHYVGLRKSPDENDDEQNLWVLKDKNLLCGDFTISLDVCLALHSKRERWRKAVNRLESDSNFADMDLCRLIDFYDDDATENKSNFFKVAEALFKRMSSGHSIVLLTMTKLVEMVEEKTLVLLDEPESHLHPPLLSAFTRALSDLLVNRNGVAIIATHSPVILQEVPKSCVSILRRAGLHSSVDRPESETFAESVGVLTREVFGLEVVKSGFYDLLLADVRNGKTYDEIIAEYGGRLGFEGRSLLRSFIANRENW